MKSTPTAAAPQRREHGFTPFVIASLALALVAACEPAHDEEEAPAIGPFLVLAAVTLDEGDDAVTLRRDDEGVWKVAGTPWQAAPRRIRALETVLRAPWNATETRPAAPTREALGLGPGDGIRVTVSPERDTPVSFTIGHPGEGCVWVDAGGAVLGCVPGFDRRLFLPTETWRDDRVGGPREADVVAVEAGGMRVERERGVWVGARADANHQAVNRLVRALESARAEPTDCPGVPAVAEVRVTTAAATTRFSLGGPEPARCLAIDGTSAFIVDDYLAAQLRRASRSLELAAVPDFGGPTVPWEVGVDAAPEQPLSAYPRPFVLALSQLRSEARAARTFDVLPWLPPSRVITLRRGGHPGHRVVLWWTDSADGVLARVDDGPLFLAERGGALRTPLSPAP